MVIMLMQLYKLLRRFRRCHRMGKGILNIKRTVSSNRPQSQGYGRYFVFRKISTRVLAVAPLAATISGSKLYRSSKQKKEIEKWRTLGYQGNNTPRRFTVARLKWSHMEDRMKYDNLIDAGKIKVPVLMVVGKMTKLTPP